MARPMTPDQWLKALRAEGVTDIVEMPGWRTNNRNHKGPFSDVHATMIHHTAGEGTGLPSYCFNGNAALPGPICHDFLARSGRLYLVGNGRANHAGTVARNAFDAVRNERSHHPAPDAAEPVDGNAVSYGLECENNGQPDRTWPAKQYDVAVRVQAARCRFHGWSADSVWAHKEATRRKPVDPRLPMDQFRRDVAERLAHPASWNPGSAPSKPTTPSKPTIPPKETDVPLSNEDVKKIWTTDGILPSPSTAAKGNKFWTPDSYLRDLHARVRATQTELAAVHATVRTLAEALASRDDAVDVDALIARIETAINGVTVRLETES
ncbi:N-acetylmuramoyl-L-alanine amidase [Streptomyces rubiginosohelvolus]|uniref:peptidoglycan recognition protein family protein n=1 Tax=Streptomyces rubiginosohelvolus TaxID=67362 RepID=UPI0033E05580